MVMIQQENVKPVPLFVLIALVQQHMIAQFVNLDITLIYLIHVPKLVLKGNGKIMTLKIAIFAQVIVKLAKPVFLIANHAIQVDFYIKTNVLQCVIQVILKHYLYTVIIQQINVKLVQFLASYVMAKEIHFVKNAMILSS